MEEPINPLFLLSLVLNVFLFISYLTLKNKIKHSRRTIRLILKGSGLDKISTLVTKITWYGKQACIYRVRYKAYEKALQHYHNRYREESLPPSYKHCTFAELCDKLVEEKFLNVNYFRNSLNSKDEPLTLSEVIKDSKKYT